MAHEFTNIKTNEALISKLRNIRPANSKEVREQRITFVLGSMDEKSNVTREQIRKQLEDAA